MKKNSELLNKNNFLTLCPGHFFTKDINGVYTGCNTSMASFAGLTSPQDIVGKTDYDMPWKENAEAMCINDKIVMQLKEELTVEETIRAINGQLLSNVVRKKPIYDDKNNVIGISGIAIDMTERKQYEEKLLLAKEKAEKETKNTLLNLEQIVASMPASFFWKNCEGVYLGLNDELAKILGVPKDEILGKTDYQLKWDPEIAEAFVQKDQEVVLSGKPILNFEEPPFRFADGRTISQLVNKVPLRNEDGEIVGVLGIGIDITERKQAEERAKIAIAEAMKLKVENAAHKAQLEAQQEMSKTASQVAHDIRSPLSSLLMIIKNCKDIDEVSRIAIREAAISIGDISNNLLSKYKPKESEDIGYVEERQPMLLSTTLLHSLSDKKFQYTDLPIKFDHAFSHDSQFAFIQVEPSSFKRMISNIINNSVDAFERREGKVTVKLGVTPEVVKVIIEDNGKGMPPHIVDKVLHNIAVTEGKADGHGIGLTQVREALARNQGKMFIDSKVGQGTQIILEFRRIQTPEWIAEEIKLGKEDTVVILDDDSSIHLAWDMRFDSILKKFPDLKVRHFENCHDAIRFIHDFTEEEKQKIYLLTDYELLKQELNGLHVVEKAKIKRSVLVTSHYADAIVLNLAAKMKTKILPKQLAPEIPIHVDESIDYQENKTPENITLKIVDLILVDDDKSFADTLIMYMFGDDTVDYFEDPKQLKDNLASYPKDTRIYLDNNFKSAGIKGVDVAKELHEQGFTRLYLLSGDTFMPGEIPDYLKVIRKDDIDNIKDW